MSRFNVPTAAPVGRGPIVTTGSTATHEGGVGFTRDARGDLFMLAIANMVGRDTFYESAGERDQRFRNLVHQVARTDLAWLARFAPFLRDEMFMRTASIVLAAEAVHEALANGGVPEGSPVTLRSLVASVLRRGDEPGELVAYWQSRYGKAIPKPIKRGIGDYLAGERFGEYVAMKYDGVGDGGKWRLGDIVEMVHPSSPGPARSALFQYLLDRRHHSGQIRTDLSLLPQVAARRVLEDIPVDERRTFLAAATDLNDAGQSRNLQWRAAGITWEWVSGWIPGGMDAEAWEAVIPSMGHMALLRNLANFDKKGVSDEVASQVAARLASPDEVAKGMQFPYRYWTAYRHLQEAGSVRWLGALDKALRLSCSNIPELPGRTLILVDTSGSMSQGGRVDLKDPKSPTIVPVDQAIVFASALARRNLGRVDVVGWANSSFTFPIQSGGSVVGDVRKMNDLVGSVGHGTNLQAGMAHLRSEHRRVFIFSDMQVHDHLVQGGRSPAGLKIYGWNLGGYGPTALDTRRPDHHELGGLSDKMFSMIPMLESGSSADWPF